MSTMDSPNSTTPPIAPKKAPILAGIAMILAIIAIAFGAINFLATHANQEQMQRLSQSTALTTQQQTQAIDTLKNSSMQATVNSAYTRSAVKYLINLANIELNIQHDPVAALHALQLAQHELNNAYPELNAALTQDIDALQALPDIHLHKIFSDLINLSNQIEKISMVPSEKPITMKKTMEEIKSSVNDAHKNWREKLWESVSQVKNLFVIRHLDQPNTPLLDMQLSMAAKQNMMSQINMAEWALLHHDQTVYQTALKTVAQWLTQYFSLASDTAPLVTKVNVLSAINISPALPSLKITLDAIANIDTPLPTQKNLGQKKIVPPPRTLLPQKGRSK